MEKLQVTNEIQQHNSYQRIKEQTPIHTDDSMQVLIKAKSNNSKNTVVSPKAQLISKSSEGSRQMPMSPKNFNSSRLKKKKISALKIRDGLCVSNSNSDNSKRVQATTSNVEEEEGQVVEYSHALMRHTNVFKSGNPKKQTVICTHKKKRSKSHTNYQYLQYTHDRGSTGMNLLKHFENSKEDKEINNYKRCQLEGPKNLIRELKDFEKKARQRLKSDLMRVKIEQTLMQKVSNFEDSHMTVNSNELKGTIAQQLIRDEIQQIYSNKCQNILQTPSNPKIFLQKSSKSHSIEEQVNPDLLLEENRDEVNQIQNVPIDTNSVPEENYNEKNTSQDVMLEFYDFNKMDEMNEAEQLEQLNDAEQIQTSPFHNGDKQSQVISQAIETENEQPSMQIYSDQIEVQDQNIIDYQYQQDDHIEENDGDANYNDGQPKLQYSEDLQGDYEFDQFQRHVEPNVGIRELLNDHVDLEQNQIEEQKSFISIGNVLRQSSIVSQSRVAMASQDLSAFSVQQNSPSVHTRKSSQPENLKLDNLQHINILQPQLFISPTAIDGSPNNQIDQDMIFINNQNQFHASQYPDDYNDPRIANATQSPVEPQIQLTTESPINLDKSNKLNKKLERLLQNKNLAIESNQGRKQKISKKNRGKGKQSGQTQEEYIEISRNDLQDKLIEESNIQITKLKNHIRQNHPKKTNEEWWPIDSSTGSFFNFKKIQIPEFMQDIGLGASLYILTLKSLGMIFLVLTLLNIPALYFFYSGNESEFRAIEGLNKLFFQFSLGNIGEYRFACSRINYASLDTEINIKCDVGIHKQLVSFGLVHDYNQQCIPRLIDSSYAFTDESGKIHFGKVEKNHKPTNVYEKYMDYQNGCGTILDEDMLNSDYRLDLQSQFHENCVNKTDCTVKLDYKTLKPDCMQIIKERSQSSEMSSNLRDSIGLDFIKKDQPIEPELIFVSLCEIDEVTLAGTNTKISKGWIAIIIVILDIFSLLIVQIFLNLLIIMQKNFAKQFDLQTVEMRDYTVRMEQLPLFFKEVDDEIQMKFEIWMQIQDRIQDGINVGICDKDLNPQIVEINFAYKNKLVLYTLRDIIKMCETIELHNIELLRASTMDERSKCYSIIWKKHAKLKKVVEEFNEKYEGKSIVEAIKASNNTCLYDQITQVYITFMSMETRDTILDVLFRRDMFQPNELRQYYKDNSKKKKDNFKDKMFSFLQKSNPQQKEVANLKDQAEVSAPIQLDMDQLKVNDSKSAGKNKEKSPIISKDKKPVSRQSSYQSNDSVEQKNLIQKQPSPDSITQGFDLIQKDQQKISITQIKKTKTKIDLSAFMGAGDNKTSQDKAIRSIIDEIWDNYDDDNSGELDREECRNFVRDALGNMQEAFEFDDDGFDEIFDSFDPDGSGQVDKDEMVEFIKNLMFQANNNGDEEGQGEEEEEDEEIVSPGGTITVKKGLSTGSKSMAKALGRSMTLTVEKEIKRIESQIQTWEPPDPEYILWENIGYSPTQRNRRKSLSIFVAMLLVIFTIWTISYFNEQKAELNELQVPTECNSAVTKQQAYDDIQKHHDEREVLIGCYCYALLINDYNEFFESNFEDLGGPDTPNHCDEWFQLYRKAQFFLYGSSLVVVGINVLAQEIFEIFARNEKSLNTASENQTIFKLIFFQSFINIGFVMLFTDKSFQKNPIMNTQWYISIGTSICFSMLLQTISTKGGHMSTISLNLLIRCYDRRCKRKWVLEENEEEPNTRQVRQNDLDSLYTGPQILIGYQFACMFTFIFVCLAYSAGMPFMYPIGTIYFFLTYWFDKVCLMRFYQKTMVFNEELPIQSTQLFKFAIMIHIIFAAFMYSTSNILYSSNPYIDFQLELDVTHIENFWSPHFCLFITNVIICAILYIIYRLNFTKISVLLLNYLQKVENFEQQLFSSSDEPVNKNTKKEETLEQRLQIIQDLRGSIKIETGSVELMDFDNQHDYIDMQDQQAGPNIDFEPINLEANTITNLKGRKTPVISFKNSIDVKLDNDSMISGLERNLNQNLIQSDYYDMQKEGGSGLGSQQNSGHHHHHKPSIQSSESIIQDIINQENDYNNFAGRKNRKLPQKHESCQSSSEEKHENQEKCVHDGDEKCVLDNDFVATDFYGELLFDYIDVYYENLIQYILRLKNAKSKMKGFYKHRPDKMQRFQDYIDEQLKNKEKIEWQISQYYDFILERLSSAQGGSLEKSQSKVVMGSMEMGSFQEFTNRDKASQEVVVTNSITDPDVPSATKNLNIKASLLPTKMQSQTSKNSTKPLQPLLEDKIENDSVPADDKTSSYSFKSSITSPSQRDLKNQQIMGAFTKAEREFQAKLDYLNDNFDEDQLNEHYFPNNLRCTSFSQSYCLTDNAEFNDADLAIERANLLIIDPVIFKQDYINSILSDQKNARTQKQKMDAFKRKMSTNIDN